MSTLTATLAAPLTIAVGCASKIGPRQQNDDAATYSVQHDFFAVADGIGGAPHGDVASACAVNAAIQARETGATLLEAFRAANNAVIQLCTWIASPETGTTLLLGEHREPEDDGTAGTMSFVWAGDTAAFLLHDGAVSCITPPDRLEGTNALRTAVGYTPDIPVQHASCPFERGDRLLLATDGVWETLDAERLATLLSSSDNAPWLAESITREAAEHGHDNATAIVLIAGASTTLDDAPAIEPPADVPPLPHTPTCPQTCY